MLYVDSILFFSLSLSVHFSFFLSFLIPINSCFVCMYNFLGILKEHSDSKSMYSEDDIIKMLEFLVDNIFVVFAGKVFQQTVGMHSNGYELCPSSHPHLSVFIRSGFHTVFALNGKETFNISVQSHLQVHR